VSALAADHGQPPEGDREKAERQSRERDAMIRGIHAMFYSSSPEELRGFLGAKLGLKSFDIGGGWLVFDLPEAEVACHGVDSDKGRNSGAHYISFYCDDIEGTVAELTARGVEFTDDIKDLDWGRMVRFRVPGGFAVDLYQPHYGKPS
jgi:catechol 2,3-dioxygenase-like lactoylglutathione lyase family enzyme